MNFLNSNRKPSANSYSEASSRLGGREPGNGLLNSGVATPNAGNLDAISLFDDIDFKSKDNYDCLDDLADLIEEKSKPMLAIAPTNMMVTKVSEAERRRNDAIALLKSLSVPDPLLGQLVTESMTGFIFVVDAQGLVEFVSDSSTENVGHTPLQIRGHTIYNFLHPADHSRFGCHLLHQQSPPTTSTDPDKARRNFTCRFKLNGVNNEAYITLYVACITVRRDQESAETSRLLCVARKLSDVSPHPSTIVTNSISTNASVVANATDLFTTKLDPATFKVMHADTSPGRLRASVAAKTLSMVGKCFLDFCHPEDRDLVRGHYLSTVRDKQSVSRVYRMTGLIGNNNGSIHQRLSNVVHVQTKSKYHKVNNSTGFILSIHSIVGDVVPKTAPSATAVTASFQPLMMPTASPKVSTLSSLLSSPSSTITASKSSPPLSASPTSENSEEAKNQLLKQLLNSNFQPQANSDEASGSLMQLLNNDKTGLKRPAGTSLDSLGPTAPKVPSVVCSENPSLTELLEKPPHLSITVPPPVPTKWHQEPREKLPKDIMRKFLPPHPAERAAAAAAAAAAATAISTKTETTSALYTVLTSRGRGHSNNGSLVYTSNSGQAETSTSASTASNVFEVNTPNEDEDDILSGILDGVIDFQEMIPVPSVTVSVTVAAATTSASDSRRISDIERYLASSDYSTAGPKSVDKPKMSSLAASSPSLTSILSAPPLVTVGRLPPVTTCSSSSSTSKGSPVNLVPRMNELLQQVPPNVSIPDTPDLDSLMLLQERRRRMSSGGSAVVVSPPPSQQPSQKPGSQLLMAQLTAKQPQPQILARRSSFSAVAAPVPQPVTSPPPGPAAAAAAAAAVHAASVSRTQRHSSGGVVRSAGQANSGPRRLSDDVQDKQRSLLQQLLSE